MTVPVASSCDGLAVLVDGRLVDDEEGGRRRTTAQIVGHAVQADSALVLFVF